MLTLILFLDFIQEIFGFVSESAEGAQNSGRASKLFLSDSPPAPAKVFPKRRNTKVLKHAHPCLGSVGSVVNG